MNNQRLEEAAILALADLPSLEVLRAKLLGLLNAPATKLVDLINTPGVAAGAGHQGASPKRPKQLNNFRLRPDRSEPEQTNNNNNVNRRFAGRELKTSAAVANAADDETTERKVIWLTLQTSWKN